MSDMIKGSCRYCGRMEMVEAMDQEGADRIVTQLCACEDATKNRRRQEVREAIWDVCTAPKEESGMDPMPDERIGVVQDIGELVYLGKIGKATLEICGCNIRLQRNANDRLEIHRACKMEASAEG